MVEDKIKLVPIPEEKLKHYLKIFKSLICCDCGIQEIDFYPYAYDSEENDVWFVGKCSNCGELCFSKE